MNHAKYQHKNNRSEYLKFAAVMIAVGLFSMLHMFSREATLMQFLESFMGVFFVVFAGFKLYNLKEFAYGFQSYDLIAAKSLLYSYFYPFIQLSFGLIYLFGLSTLLSDIAVVVVSVVSGAGVVHSIMKKAAVHCVCLGNVIKLPLSTISFIEDFGMAAMAFVMIILR